MSFFFVILFVFSFFYSKKPKRNAKTILMAHCVAFLSVKSQKPTPHFERKV